MATKLKVGQKGETKNVKVLTLKTRSAKNQSFLIAKSDGSEFWAKMGPKLVNYWTKIDLNKIKDQPIAEMSLSEDHQTVYFLKLGGEPSTTTSTPKTIQHATPTPATACVNYTSILTRIAVALESIAKGINTKEVIGLKDATSRSITGNLSDDELQPDQELAPEIQAEIEEVISESDLEDF